MRPSPAFVGLPLVAAVGLLSGVAVAQEAASPSPSPMDGAIQVDVAASPFERLWRPLDPAQVPHRYWCDGLGFTLSDLAASTPVAVADASLRSAVQRWGPMMHGGHADWFIVRADESQVLALAVDDIARDHPLSSLELRRAETDVLGAETWAFAGGGDCRPRTVFGRGIAGDWRLDPGHADPGPRTRKLHVIGDAGCNGTERRGRARVHDTGDALLIAIPMGSKIHSDMCHGLPPEPMTINLPKPIRDRALYDVGSLPIRRID